MTNTIRIHREGKNLIIHLPYSPDRVKKMRTIPNRRWDAKRKVWIIPYTDDLLERLEKFFYPDSLEIASETLFSPATRLEVDRQVNVFDQEMRLRKYSALTRKAYRNILRRFLQTISILPQQITEKDIRKYLLHLIDDKNVSKSYLNQTISTIKFYFAQVLKQPKTISDLPRPRKQKKLPGAGLPCGRGDGGFQPPAGRKNGTPGQPGG